MQAINTSSHNLSQEQISAWFDNTISHLEADKFMLQNDIANKDTNALYATLIGGDSDKIIKDFRKTSGIIFSKRMVVDFVGYILNSEYTPNSLAFAISDSKVFIWAEIEDDDEKAEDAIIEAEGKVNANCYDIGYNVSATIVERSDNLSVPSHYVDIPIKKLRENWRALQNT